MSSKPKPATPAEYIEALDEPRRGEIARIDAFIRATVPALAPAVVGGMLGYGPFHYRYASGHEGDTCKVCLASNKTGISIYACGANEKGAFATQYARRLGKVSCGKGCIRFRRFDDVDHDALAQLLKDVEAYRHGK